MDITRESYLLLLCGVYLAFILINGWFKLHINVKKGQVGERMLRRLRYELYERVLRFPPNHFDRAASGATIAMMTGELEPIGGFVGDAFALPISQGGTLLTIFVFMFVQDPILGAAAVAFYPLQGYLVPKLQRIIRRLGRTRVQKIRLLSDRIGETIAARREIRVNHGAPYQLADIAHRLGEIYDIRFEIYNRKFFVKFLNNFIGSARRVLADRLSRDDLGHLVERLASNRYDANSPVSANLLFGTPIGSVFEGDRLARNVYVESVLDRVGLTGDLVEVGTQVARIMVELLAGLRPEHEFFEEVGLINAEDLPVFERILMRIEKTGVEALSPEENVRLVSLAFKLVAARDPLGLVDDNLEQRILQARQVFAENLPQELKGSVEFFDPDRYNAAAPVQ